MELIIFLLFIVYLAIVSILTVQMSVSILAAIFGDQAISFMEHTYTKNAESGYDRFLNIVFYLFYGVPHYFYKKFMIKYPREKARFIYFNWMLGFVLIVFIVGISVTLLVESYTDYL
ncbi:hypothetical protein [Alkalihalophilus marmarensis]|uniref:Uncharacterized protein n=1 Tax=Alkalihalophilus marmarensis DSM 21297 TaxID=1188261 RepID=U6STG9_9BACI|nr:hypothetical protein [Alkalihalophilus marmarensis]ERN54908.1 hypothetical protein A33I_04335 [Alkalihalophilus marmarensis DSM 21297]